MAQQRHMLDMTKSLLITEVDTYQPETSTPDKDNQRIGLYPTIPYEARNVLPTHYGYKSFFGLGTTQDSTGLPVGIVPHEYFAYQTSQLVTIHVLLSDTGVYMREEGLAWEQVMVLPAPPVGADYMWTQCVLKNVVFFYRQDQDKCFGIEEYEGANGLQFGLTGIPLADRTDEGKLASGIVGVVSFVPTTINMTGQLGIYRAGGSLGFWDSEDAVSWSSPVNLGDFTPTLTTLANTTSLTDLVGKITTIKGFGDGFVVYATKSIIRLVEDSGSLQRFRADPIYSNVGVVYPKEVAVAQPDNVHFAWTTAGLAQIEIDQHPSIIVPEVTDWIRQARAPVYLAYLNNRYLCMQLLDANQITGNVEFSTQTVDPEDLQYLGGSSGGGYVPEVSLPASSVCFTPPEGEPAAGTKPFAVYPFYEGWVDEGPNLTHELVNLVVGVPEIDDLELELVPSATLVDNSSYSKVNINRPNPVYPSDPSDVIAFEQAQKNSFITAQATSYASAYQSTTKADVDTLVQDAVDAHNSTTSSLNAELIPFVWADIAALTVNNASEWYNYPQIVQDTFEPDNLGTWDRPTFTRITTQGTPSVTQIPASITWDQTMNPIAGLLAERAVPPIVRGREYTIGAASSDYYPDGGFIPYFAGAGNAVYTRRFRYTEIDNATGQTAIDEIWEMPALATTPFNYTSNIFLMQEQNAYSTTIGGLAAADISQVVLDGGSVTDILAEGRALDLGAHNGWARGRVNLGTPSQVGIYTNDSVTTVNLAYLNGRDYQSSSITFILSEYAVVKADLSSIDLTIADLPDTDTLEYADRTSLPVSDLRGLVGVDTWWFNNNNSNTELDATAILTTPYILSTMEFGMDRATSSVDEDGAFSNRYYTYSASTGQAGEQERVCGALPPLELAGVPVYPVTYEPWTVEIPELTWILQNGSPAPLDPTFQGMYVYDTQLQKWGNMVGEYKLLTDYQPLGGIDTQGAISYKDFMIDGGAFLPTGELAVFNSSPSDSYIRYGKYRHWPANTTALEEVNVNFNEASTGLLSNQYSVDGRNLSYGLGSAVDFTDSLRAHLGCDTVGKWHTITVSGKFDIAQIEVVSHPAGRR